MEQMVNHGTGWVRMEYLRAGARPDRLPHRVPHRDARHRPAAPRLRPLGAVGRRAAHAPDRRAGRRPPRARRRSSRCSTCRSAATLFVGPGDEVYEGMIVGENARADDLDVNAAQGEAADEHALLDRRRARAPRPARASCRSTRRSSSCATTSASRSTPDARAPAQGRARQDRPRQGRAASAQRSGFAAGLKRAPARPASDQLEGRVRVGARNNANMSTLPEGTSSITNMYLWQPQSRARSTRPAPTATSTWRSSATSTAT